MADRIYDVILVGGGVMGCATAYYLLKMDPKLDIAILETDPSFTYNSTVLSDGNTRIQFNLKENIQISLYGLEVLRNFASEMAVNDQSIDIGFRQQGNLFLADEAGRDNALNGLELQLSLGCQVEWLEAEEIRQRFPLYAVNDVAGGTFGPLDGTMDPNAVLSAYKNKAISLGAKYLSAEAKEILKSGNQIAGVTLASGERLSSNFVVNSAGAWASNLARSLGIDLPVQPVKRQVFVLETNIRPDYTIPLTVTPSGLYLIHENGGIFMCGKSLPDDPVGFEFNWDRTVFEDKIWPELVELAPDFDRLKVSSGWAGLYAVNTLDGNAILGEWPEIKGFMLANGFSGHGFQQCHAVGRYIAELILGQPRSLDLSIFSPRRILENKPVFENQHKLV